LTFFVDRSLGRRIVPSALRDAGYDVVVHDDIFAANADDEIWLAEAGRRGWIVLMKDDRIRYRPRERAALEAAGVQAFALTNANMTGEQQAHLLRTHATRIQRFCTEHPGPFVVGVYQERPFLRPLHSQRGPRGQRCAARRRGRESG
jgi:predicted nuclease of predicted toxin-antitoxin system